MRLSTRGVTGIVVGVSATQVGVAQDTRPRALSHVGVSVKNFAASLEYYTKTVGLKEAYSLKQADGSPLLTYLYVSKDTFLELVPASAQQPPGIYHFAVEYSDLNSAIGRIRQAGAPVADAGLTPGKALFSRLRGPDGEQIELMEFGPESQQRAAMNAWKP